MSLVAVERNGTAGGKMQGAGGKRMTGKAGRAGETGGGREQKKERRESVSLFVITTSLAV